jgi:hypothetical protein
MPGEIPHMKRIHPAVPSLFVMLFLGFTAVHAQDDTVTIPKSRLEELERKAAELDKLQGELDKSKAEQDKLRQAKEEADRKAAEEAKAAAAAKAEAEKQTAAAKKSAEDARAATAAQARAAASQSVPVYTAPPIDSLPPLKPGQPVSAMDLTAHYVADPPGAAARYGKGLITVEGEVVGFDKTVFMTPYEILLKTGDPTRRVVCTITPPREYKAVYPSKSGSVLIGIDNRGGEVTLLRVGQSVAIEGRCGGMSGLSVVLKSGVLKAASAPETH